ncbi:hypothetical protein WEI85_45540 [Actinomycetes bacterium KLBMP 9797]
MRNLRDQVAREFLTRPGVTGVGIGAKVVEGRPTGQVAVTVFVEEKLPRTSLTAAELLPPEVDGVPTDVLMLRDPQLAAEPIGAKHPDEGVYVDDERHRPITGGMAIRGNVVENQLGTIGCLLHAANEPPGAAANVYALTCHHVIANVSPLYNGDKIFGLRVDDEPTVGKTICGQNDLKMHSTCCRGVFGRYAGGEEDVEWDAAVVRLDGGTGYRYDMRRASVPATGEPGDDDVAVAGVAPLPTDQQLATHSYLVRKRGVATGLTGGYVVAAHSDISFAGEPPDGGPRRVWARDTLVIAPHPNPQVPADEHNHFVVKGDSGSVSMDTVNRVLGLNFGTALAGVIQPTPPSPPQPTYFGLAFPVSKVLTKFAGKGVNLKVGTATEPGQTHTVPGSPTITSVVDGERVVVPVPEPVPAGAAAGAPPPGVDQLGADLQATPGGRELLDFWRIHSPELRRLVNSDRRVAAAWHRSGGSAVYQILLRGLENGALRIPATVNGQPLERCLDLLHRALRAAAGEPLRAALDRLRGGLPDLAGLTYPELLTALSHPTTR